MCAARGRGGTVRTAARRSPHARTRPPSPAPRPALPHPSLSRAQAKPKFERRIDFEHFLDALAALAERKYADYAPSDGLRLLIAHHLAPHHALVTEEMAKTGDTAVPLTGVYKKLYDPRSYTGVYAERFRSGDGRINGDTGSRAGKSFRGNTNTGSDETIHDISVLMRPNLRGGSMMTTRPVPPGGSPRAGGGGGAPGGSTRSLLLPPRHGGDGSVQGGY